jgi:hypothetical protein
VSADTTAHTAPGTRERALGHQAGGMRLGRLVGMKELWPILLENVVPAMFGLIAGVVGSLFGPLVQWAVEKRRGRMNYRKDLIKQWRKDFEEFEYDKHKLGDSASYSALRPHLRASVRDTIEKPRTAYVPNEGRHGSVKQQMILDEVARLEKKWGLV